MSNVPPILTKCMNMDKKPFTYLPGGIDFSELKSPQMARRVARNQDNMSKLRQETPCSSRRDDRSSLPPMRASVSASSTKPGMQRQGSITELISCPGIEHSSSWDGSKNQCLTGSYNPYLEIRPSDPNVPNFLANIDKKEKKCTNLQCQNNDENIKQKTVNLRSNISNPQSNKNYQHDVSFAKKPAFKSHYNQTVSIKSNENLNFSKVPSEICDNNRIRSVLKNDDYKTENVVFDSAPPPTPPPLPKFQSDVKHSFSKVGKGVTENISRIQQELQNRKQISNQQDSSSNTKEFDKNICQNIDNKICINNVKKDNDAETCNLKYNTKNEKNFSPTEDNRLYSNTNSVLAKDKKNTFDKLNQGQVRNTDKFTNFKEDSTMKQSSTNFRYVDDSMKTNNNETNININLNKDLTNKTHLNVNDNYVNDQIKHVKNNSENINNEKIVPKYIDAAVNTHQDEKSQLKININAQTQIESNEQKDIVNNVNANKHDDIDNEYEFEIVYGATYQGKKHNHEKNALKKENPSFTKDSSDSHQYFQAKKPILKTNIKLPQCSSLIPNKTCPNSVISNVSNALFTNLEDIWSEQKCYINRNDSINPDMGLQVSPLTSYINSGIMECMEDYEIEPEESTLRVSSYVVDPTTLSLRGQKQNIVIKKSRENTPFLKQRNIPANYLDDEIKLLKNFDIFNYSSASNVSLPQTTNNPKKNTSLYSNQNKDKNNVVSLVNDSSLQIGKAEFESSAPAPPPRFPSIVKNVEFSNNNNASNRRKSSYNNFVYQHDYQDNHSFQELNHYFTKNDNKSPILACRTLRNNNNNDDDDNVLTLKDEKIKSQSRVIPINVERPQQNTSRNNKVYDNNKKCEETDTKQQKIINVPIVVNGKDQNYNPRNATKCEFISDPPLNQATKTSQEKPLQSKTSYFSRNKLNSDHPIRRNSLNNNQHPYIGRLRSLSGPLASKTNKVPRQSPSMHKLTSLHVYDKPMVELCANTQEYNGNHGRYMPPKSSNI